VEIDDEVGLSVVDELTEAFPQVGAVWTSMSPTGETTVCPSRLVTRSSSASESERDMRGVPDRRE